MTTINPVLGAKVLVKVGDGAQPEVFAHPAVINTSRAITGTVNVETDELVDLADQEAIAQTARRARSIDWKIDGAGLIDDEDTLEWLQWVGAGTSKNIIVTDGNFKISGPFILTSFSITGERTKLVECQITLECSGPVAVVAAS